MLRIHKILIFLLHIFVILSMLGCAGKEQGTNATFDGDVIQEPVQDEEVTEALNVADLAEPVIPTATPAPTQVPIEEEPTALPSTPSPTSTVPTNPYTDLSIPTYITKVNDIYFIVDCYHNQVIYHDNLEDDLSQWHIMSANLNQPHTLASDGTVYLIDDTENHRVVVLCKEEDAFGNPVFVQTQEFAEIGVRPHYTIYHEESETFYVWSSMTGEMYLFKRLADSTEVELVEVKSVPELNGVYVRSFTIMDDDIYFVSGNSSILQVDRETFETLNTYPVVPEIAGMVQLTRIQDYFYITISTDASGNQDYATLIKVETLNELAAGSYIDIYDEFIDTGTPYNMTQIDGLWYLTEHRVPGVGIWRFDVQDNEITDVELVY